MNGNSMNSQQAAELFLSLLIDRAYNGAIGGTTSLLEKGPPGRKPRQDLVLLHQWFQDLDEESRGQVLNVVRQAVDAAVFGCLALLDGVAGYPIEGKISDFAVYLQVYKDIDARKANSPTSSVRLNPAYTAEFLHDMYRWILQERVEQDE